MKFASVCSGIEAASVAWAPLGWRAAFLSEIEPFPCAVLAHHYPHVPNRGDMTKFKDWPDASIDLLCGGTPCQSFSVAGLRNGLDDPRGNLMLTFGAIAARYRPRWLVWENVPGVLSSNGGRDFGAFLGLLGVIGYGFAYRVLDAQFVRVDGYGRAVPQRRNRVFVVGCLGDWRSAAAVLLEREGLRGDLAPRRSSWARVAATLTRGAESGGRGGYDGRRQEDDTNIIGVDLYNAAETGEVVGTLGAAIGGVNTGHGAVRTLRAKRNMAHREDVDTLAVSFCLNAKGWGRLDGESETLIPTTGAGFDEAAIAFDARQSDVIQYGDKTGPLDTCGFTMGVQTAAAVRRLTPRECERLQGFPDDYTAIPYRGKPAADGPRYKSLGNSWAVNCARWIGWRISVVDAITARERAAA